MVYRGKIQNGVVVFDGTSRLPEGTEVEIVPSKPVEPPGKPRRGSLEAILPYAGIWADQAEEMDRSLAELREMKDEELRRQLSKPDPQL
jgi:hypothetical protein